MSGEGSGSENDYAEAGSDPNTPNPSGNLAPTIVQAVPSVPLGALAYPPASEPEVLSPEPAPQLNAAAGNPALFAEALRTSQLELKNELLQQQLQQAQQNAALQAQLAATVAAADAREARAEERSNRLEAQLRDQAAAFQAQLAEAQRTIADGVEKVDNKVYVQHVATNPAPAPRNPHRKNEAPGLIDGRGDKTFDVLVLRKSAHYWEWITLSSLCSFLYDIVDCCEKTFPRLIQRIEESSVAFQDEDGKEILPKNDSQHLHAVYNSIKGCYDNLANPRVNLLQLRSLFGPDKMSDENRALLEVFNDKVYGSLRESLPDNLSNTFKECLEMWEKKKSESTVKAAATKAAGAAKKPDAGKAQSGLGAAKGKVTPPAPKGGSG